jgi:uncharacterized protein (TIGR03435 family)
MRERFGNRLFSVAMNRSQFAGCALVALVAMVFTWRMSAQIQDLKPMARDAHPSFEVATIKPSDPDAHGSGFQTTGRSIFIENETMNNMISFAYGVHAKQIVGGLPWFGSQRFDIRGLPDVDGMPNAIQLQEMVRKLLTDRFHLQFQREKREMPCFALTVAKGGPKITASKSGPDALRDQSGNRNAGQVSWRITNNSMDEFAQFLQMAVLDRPVVDQTGLKGKFDFKLTWTTNSEAATTDANAAPGFLTAIQEQAGLKVEPSRAEVEVLVITHAEQPSPN